MSTKTWTIPNDRLAVLTEGLRYGEAGRRRTEEVVELALHLLAESGRGDLFKDTNIRNEFEEQLADYPAEILAEHFSKLDSLNYLFELARVFEGQAFASQMVSPHQCSSDQKAIMGLLCDFLGVERREII
ncbi:MAG: hypothetical protein JST85_26900 [Acidobacteria bacterium]|nr:hypothetical protein [Acidobacteriota bacterium]